MKRPKILIIDDDVGLLEGLRLTCDMHGFDATLVDAGHKAIKILANEDFDLVITDLRMPGMNGQETIKVLKQLKPKQNIAVLSGYAEPEPKKACMDMGVTRFLSKNFSASSFVKWVNEILLESGA